MLCSEREADISKMAVRDLLPGQCWLRMFVICCSACCGVCALFKQLFLALLY